MPLRSSSLSFAHTGVAPALLLCTGLRLAAGDGTLAQAPDPYPDPLAIPGVARFLAADEPGRDAPPRTAPPEVDQFGRLVGIWDARQEIRRQDGTWMPGAPALWIWKYALGGFATQDLWLQTEEHLPPYLSGLGRDYQLTGLRVFDAGTGGWHVAWAANGGAETPGPDFGVLTAASKPVPAGERVEGAAPDRMILSGESEYGRQRITFYDITPRSFSWLSEFASEAGEWQAIMRVQATRR